MMPTDLIGLGLGAGGILLILVLREVFAFLKARRQDTAVDKMLEGVVGMKTDMVELQRDVKDLWNWHNKEDDDGVKIWYVRKSLEEAIMKLSDNIAKQTEILAEMGSEMKQSRAELRRIESDLRDK